MNIKGILRSGKNVLNLSVLECYWRVLRRFILLFVTQKIRLRIWKKNCLAIFEFYPVNINVAYCAGREGGLFELFANRTGLKRDRSRFNPDGFSIDSNERHCAYSQSLLTEQKHDGVDEVSRHPVIEYHLVCVNDRTGRYRPRRVPQHELERILQSLFSAYHHYLTPRQRVLLVQRYVVHRNHVGPAYKTRKTR